jgi:hypothetical protein
MRKIMNSKHTDTARSGMITLAKTAFVAGVLVGFAPAVAMSAALEKKGSTSYTSHYVFHPMGTVELPGVGKATSLEMVGTTENTKGEAAFDNMKAKCQAVNVETGGKKWIEGACAMTDKDGDVVFSTFDTRDLDAAQPEMDCGTHIITGGTGKYKGISGTEPFACVEVATPAGEPAGSFAMDIPHNTAWAIQ